MDIIVFTAAYLGLLIDWYGHLCLQRIKRIYCILLKQHKLLHFRNPAILVLGCRVVEDVSPLIGDLGALVDVLKVQVLGDFLLDMVNAKNFVARAVLNVPCHDDVLAWMRSKRLIVLMTFMSGNVFGATC